MSAESSNDGIEPDIGGDPFGLDVVARLADLAEVGTLLLPLLGTFGDIDVAVCFAGADVEQLRNMRGRLGESGAWALVVLAPGAAPWVVDSRECCTLAVAKALELMAGRAAAPHARHCIAGAVRLLAEAVGLHAGELETALVLANTIVTRGARAAHPVTVVTIAQDQARGVSTCSGLSPGAVKVAQIIHDGGARAAFLFYAVEGGTAVATSTAPDVSEAEIRGLIRDMTGEDLPENGLTRHHPPA